MELKTPLYDTHVACGGKIVPFASYLLPVQYQGGIAAEHMAVRTAAGLFDVSHMGEVTFEGADALDNINLLVTNDCSGMYDGQVRYSPMCNENGGVVDDLLVYRKNENSYLIVINAANHDKDVAWMKERVSGNVVFSDISAQISQLAIQGPAAQAIMEKITPPETLPVKYYSFVENARVGGVDCLVSRTGYTGEDGFELYCQNADAARLWEVLMDAGSENGLIPCGLGARDTLRLEAAMPLYGHEMNDEITPLETGLGHFVKLGKSGFIGKDALLAKGRAQRERIGLELVDRGIAREHDKVFLDGKEIGFVTSGTMCPYLKKAVAMALVPVATVTEDSVIHIETRGRMLAAKPTELPFYSRKKK